MGLTGIGVNCMIYLDNASTTYIYPEVKEAII